MVKSYHPLAWYWLNAVRGFNANAKQDVNVLADCKDYKDVLHIKEHLLFKSLKINLRTTPVEEQNAACMKQARARRREMWSVNQKQYYSMKAHIKCFPDSEDNVTIIDKPQVPQPKNPTQTDAAANTPNPTDHSALPQLAPNTAHNLHLATQTNNYPQFLKSRSNSK